MGNAVVDAQLHHLGVNHEQAQVVGCISEQETVDNRINTDRLTRTRCAGNEQMGHSRHVADNRLPFDIFAQGNA